MKIKQLSSLLVGVALIATSSFTPAYAQTPHSDASTLAVKQNSDSAVPYYLFVQNARLTFTCSASSITYRIAINGTADLKSVSGTATLYKKNSSGTYEKKESNYHTFTGQSINESSSFDSYGRGDYKVVFDGTAYSYDGLTDPLYFQLERTY